MVIKEINFNYVPLRQMPLNGGNSIMRETETREKEAARSMADRMNFTLETEDCHFICARHL